MMLAIESSTAHILMCGDSGYFQHIAACLVSLLDHNPKTNFSVVVLATRTTKEMDAKLYLSLGRYPNIVIKIVPFNPQVLAGLPLAKGYYPIEIYARFWVADHFPEDVDRVLYLDGDMVIMGSVAPLFQLDLGGNMLAAVPIPGSVSPARLGYDPKFGYFNSGVLVINLKEWRTENARDFLIFTAHALTDKLNDPDQDVLNFCFHDRYIKLDYVWNAISPFFKEINSLTISSEETQRIVREARIIHFNGAAKPWNYLSFHPYTKEYLRCVAKTEWRGFEPIGFGPINFLKKWVIAVFGERMVGQTMAALRRQLPSKDG